VSLELAVSRAVTQSHLLERALHSQATWFMQIDALRVKATREEHEHGVRFTACFSVQPGQSNVVTLLEDEVIRSAQEFASPDEGCFYVVWNLSVEENARA